MADNFKSQIFNLKSNLKSILIIAIVVVLIGIGLAVYFVWVAGPEVAGPEAAEGPGPLAPGTATAPLGEFEIENPKMTVPLEETEIPEGVIQLEISSDGFSPREFNVQSSQPISLTLTGLDKGTHILKFDSHKLINVIIAVAGDTRGISFMTPEKGDYAFYCSIPGDREAGEAGVMHVE